MTLGEYLKKIREEKCYSQEGMASLLNVNQSTFSRFERDKIIPGRDILNKISDCFGVPMEELIAAVEESKAKRLVEQKNKKKAEKTDSVVYAEADNKYIVKNVLFDITKITESRKLSNVLYICIILLSLMIDTFGVLPAVYGIYYGIKYRYSKVVIWLNVILFVCLAGYYLHAYIKASPIYPVYHLDTNF